MKQPNDNVRQAAAAAWRFWVISAQQNEDLGVSASQAFKKLGWHLQHPVIDEWAYAILHALMAYHMVAAIQPIAHRASRLLGDTSVNLTDRAYPELVGSQHGFVSRFFTDEDVRALTSFFEEASAHLLETSAAMKVNAGDTLLRRQDGWQVFNSAEVNTLLDNMAHYYPTAIQAMEALVKDEFSTFLSLTGPHASPFWLMSVTYMISSLQLHNGAHAAKEENT